MKFTSIVLAGALAVSASVANASLIGSTTGPDSSFSINFSFSNGGIPDLLSLSLDGSTANAGSVFWDGLGTPGGSAVLGSSSGAGTTVATFTFAAGGFASGDDFTLTTVDPDFVGGPSGVEIGELAGVSVSAIFADMSSFSGSFVDDPAAGAGLILEQTTAAVPLPAGGALLLAGLGAFGALRGRRKKA
jgi:hypothetical protein